MRYFNLFSDILITKGASRILISDLQRNVSELHSLELHEFIEELKTSAIEEVLGFYDDESKEIAQEYLDFLLEKEYGFITWGNWDHNFPPLSYDFHDYNIISDIFIELEDISVLNKIKHAIINLKIKHIVIYCSRDLSFDDFYEIDNHFKDSAIESIEIFSSFNTNVDEAFFQNLNLKTARIHSLVFYNCKKTPFEVKDIFRFNLNFSDQDLKISSCGKVDLKYFSTNLTKVLEAVNHNSCLHKKIGIDRNGNIKNCPAMPQSFGNITETTLEEALRHPDFKKYWNLTKDHIEGCKDCEFRYVCTDCRAYTEQTHINKSGLDTSKPLKCGYSPYTNEWEEWSTNPLKQKAIQIILPPPGDVTVVNR